MTISACMLCMLDFEGHVQELNSQLRVMSPHASPLHRDISLLFPKDKGMASGR